MPHTHAFFIFIFIAILWGEYYDVHFTNGTIEALIWTETEFSVQLTLNPPYVLSLKQATGQETAFAKWYPTAETHLFEGTFAGIYN